MPAMASSATAVADLAARSFTEVAADACFVAGRNGAAGIGAPAVTGTLARQARGGHTGALPNVLLDSGEGGSPPSRSRR